MIQSSEEMLRDEAFKYLVDSYNSTLGLCYENPEAKDVYWISHDNVLASFVLQEWNREIADNVTETVKKLSQAYNLTTSEVGIPLDCRAEILLGYQVSVFFNRTENVTLNDFYYGSVLMTEIATNDLVTDFENYTDLLCYASLVEWRRENYSGADLHYEEAKEMWDGNGFRDAAFEKHHFYATYKLGLFYFLNRMLCKGSFEFERELIERVWHCQDKNGGFKTDYYADGSFPSGCQTNTETTSIILLGDIPCTVPTSSEDVMVGAYYYIWWGIPFNNHWEHGVKYTPFLGEYNSSDSLTADRHILLAKDHGIDFFVVSWIGIGTWVDWVNATEDHTWDFDEIDWNLNYSFLKAPHLLDFNFCLFYETEIVLNAAIQGGKNFTEIFINDITYAAENYFVNPSYLRVDDRPVLFIYNLPYLYQNLSTPKAQRLFSVLRQRLTSMDLSVYLVGDVGPGPSPNDVNSNWTYSMNAVTNYFFAHHLALLGWQNIMDYAETYYPEWCSEMNSQGIKFIPNAYPGYDNTEHCEWKQSQNMSCTPIVLSLNETRFEELLSIALNYADDDLKMIMITSWNERLESTAIEPSMEFGETFLHTVYLIPEFPSFLILPLFLITTLSAVRAYRKRKSTLKV